jgi:hypothetical protein
MYTQNVTHNVHTWLSTSSRRPLNFVDMLPGTLYNIDSPCNGSEGGALVGYVPGHVHLEFGLLGIAVVSVGLLCMGACVCVCVCVWLCVCGCECECGVSVCVCVVPCPVVSCPSCPVPSSMCVCMCLCSLQFGYAFTTTSIRGEE